MLGIQLLVFSTILLIDQNQGYILFLEILMLVFKQIKESELHSFASVHQSALLKG